MLLCASLLSFGTGLHTLVVLAIELFKTQIYSAVLNACKKKFKFLFFRLVEPGAVSGLFFLSPCHNYVFHSYFFTDEVESSDSGSVPSTLRRKGSDSSGSLGSFGTKGKLRSLRSQLSLNSAGTFRKSLPENIPDLSQMVTAK